MSWLCRKFKREEREFCGWHFSEVIVILCSRMPSSQASFSRGATAASHGACNAARKSPHGVLGGDWIGAGRTMGVAVERGLLDDSIEPIGPETKSSFPLASAAARGLGVRSHRLDEPSRSIASCQRPRPTSSAGASGWSWTSAIPTAAFTAGPGWTRHLDHRCSSRVHRAKTLSRTRTDGKVSGGERWHSGWDVRSIR